MSPLRSALDRLDVGPAESTTLVEAVLASESHLLSVIPEEYRPHALAFGRTVALRAAQLVQLDPTAPLITRLPR